MKKLTIEERRLLERFVAALTANPDRDPKYDAVLNPVNIADMLQMFLEVLT